MYRSIKPHQVITQRDLLTEERETFLITQLKNAGINNKAFWISYERTKLQYKELFKKISIQENKFINSIQSLLAYASQITERERDNTQFELTLQENLNSIYKEYESLIKLLLQVDKMQQHNIEKAREL